MPRYKQYLENPQSRTRWSLGETKKLWAFLDFAIENSTRAGNGQQNKADILREILPYFNKRPRRRNLSQIEMKLTTEWIRYRDPALPKTTDDIYCSGTRSLSRLDGDLKRGIEEILQGIRISIPRQTRSHNAGGSLDFRSSRSRRDQVLPTNNAPSSETRGDRSCHHQGELRRSSRLEHKALPSEKFEQIVTGTTSKQMPSSSQHTATNPSPRVIENETGVSNSRTVATAREEMNQEVGGLRVVRHPESLSQSILCGNCQNRRKVDYGDAGSTSQFLEKLACSPETQDLVRDNIYFRREWLLVKAECDRLQRNARLQHSLPTLEDPDSDPKLVTRIKQQDQQIAQLQRQLKIKLSLDSFTNCAGDERRRPNIDKTKSSHFNMERALINLALMDDLRHPREEVEYIESQDLGTLKRRLFGQEVHSIRQNEIPFPPELFVQSLAGAAICEWVFDEKLQCYDMMDTPGFEAFRELTTTEYEVKVRDIYFATQQSIINSDKFQKENLPRTAAKHARRFLEVLKPFLMGTRSQEAKARIEQCLESIFHSALDIKTQGMIGNQVFQYIWPAYNAVVDHLSMVQENFSPKHSASGKEVKKVMLALSPGLRVYSCDKKSVDYCGFTAGNEAELGKSSLIALAVVVTA